MLFFKKKKGGCFNRQRLPHLGICGFGLPGSLGGWHQNFEASNQFLHLELFVAKFATGFWSHSLEPEASEAWKLSHWHCFNGWEATKLVWLDDERMIFVYLCIYIYIHVIMIYCILYIYIHVIMIYYDIYIYICRLYILNLYLYTIYRIMSYTNTYKCRYWLAEASDVWEARVHPTIILPLQWGGHTTPQTTPQPTGFLEKKSPAWQ